MSRRGAGAGVQAGAEPWTVLRLMRWSGRYLEEKGVPGGKLDAEHLLAHALGEPRLQLYLQYDRPLEAEELDRFRPLLQRRAQREPLQYILGRASFRELELAVDRRVLIPRPETESLVEEVLEWARAEGAGARTAVDIGTGSGAIALSLALEGPFETVTGTDVSPAALDVARRNARIAGQESKIRWLEGAFFEPLDEGDRFDAVVSNPPYVSEGEMEALEPEIAAWEPRTALVAGADGMAALSRIISEAPAWLRPGGLLALEIGSAQGQAVRAAMRDVRAYDDVRVRRDLSGRERVVLARCRLAGP